MIDEKYLIVIMIPCYVDGDGVRSVDPLWHKDLLEHLSCIRDLVLAAPLRREAPPGPVVPIDAAGLRGRLSFVDLPPSTTTVGTLLSVPAAAARLWRAVGEAEIVHVNAGGWPISFGWIAAPMAKLRGKFMLTNIESAHWRKGWDWPVRPKRLLQAIVFEGMARFCVNLSDLATFTHAGYRDGMLPRWRRHLGHVVSASWIDREVILSQARAEALWREKLEDRSRPLRVVFAASLIPNKGVRVLLEALKILDGRGARVAARVYGAGELRDDCERAARELGGGVTLELCGTLDYGAPFFAMLRDQDLLASPNLSDEQPRIVYDCFSQALPVLCSDTAGMRQCVTDGVDGRIVPAGDPRALADAIAWASEHRERLRDLGIAGLDVARGLTHDQMHARRAALIREAFRRRGRRLAATP